MPETSDETWADLLDRAIGSPPAGGPRSEALLASGHRAVRRRRVAAGAGVALAAVAVVALTVALGPGGRSPAGAPYASDPTATSSAPPTPPSTPAGTPPATPVTSPPGGDQVVVGPRYATWGADGLVGTHGSTILDQRTPVSFTDFAGPGVRTAAARVRAADGTIWFVVARETGGPQVINVAGSAQWRSLAEFIAWAQEKYRSGEGLL